MTLWYKNESIKNNMLSTLNFVCITIEIWVNHVKLESQVVFSGITGYVPGQLKTLFLPLTRSAWC